MELIRFLKIFKNLERGTIHITFLYTPSEKYLGPKQSPPISPNDLKNDGAQLLLSKYHIKSRIMCKMIFRFKLIH